MADYSKMSDFDISKAVLIALGYKPIDEDTSCAVYMSEIGRKDVGLLASKRFAFDPCNNPTDAWTVIIRNLISIDSLFDRGNTWLAFGGDDSEYRCVHSNPLRAAMIVFLMMKEQG